MNILSIFLTTVVAANTIISPVNESLTTTTAPISKPQTSFGSLLATPTPQPTPAVIGPTKPTPTPTPRPKTTKKRGITIALLGDSMIDTLGPTAPHLVNALKRIYPRTTFSIKNYGVGGTTLTYGIERITHGYTYLGTSYVPLIATNPDIVVVESFGYNPTGDDESAITTHWLLLAQAIDTIKANLPDAAIVIAATIAPNATRFGDGAPGISFSLEDKTNRVETIKKYLENTVRFAKSQHLPLADAYHASLTKNGNGNIAYINKGDFIHYSDAGRTLMAEKIAATIVANRLLE